MKAFSIIVLVIFYGIPAIAQENERFISTLTPGSSLRFMDQPILDVFGVKDPGFSFSVDSAILTRDYIQLISCVEKLDRLEKKTKLHSTYLSAAGLFDTTLYLMERKGFENISLEILASAGKTGEDMGVKNTNMNLLYKEIAYRSSLSAEDTTNDYVPSRGRAAQSQAKTARRAMSSPPPPQAPKSTNELGVSGGSYGAGGNGKNGDGMKVINKSAKNLYVYVDEDYKGILYPAKQLLLSKLAGCHTVVAESIDRFKAKKSYCFQSGANAEWIISN